MAFCFKIKRIAKIDYYIDYLLYTNFEAFNLYILSYTLLKVFLDRNLLFFFFGKQYLICFSFKAFKNYSKQRFVGFYFLYLT